MASRTAAEGRTIRINSYKVGAAVAQFFSFLTTFWAIEWVIQPTSDQQYALTLALSLGGEFLLVKMKGLLFDEEAGNDAAGWIGFAIDTVTNCGGIITKTGRLLTWPPVAILMTAFGYDPTDPRVNAIGAFVLAIIGGAILSFLPHRLWRAGSGTKK